MSRALDWTVRGQVAGVSGNQLTSSLNWITLGGMEPPILRVVRAVADEPSPTPSPTEPVRTPMRWTLPMSEPAQENDVASAS